MVIWLHSLGDQGRTRKWRGCEEKLNKSKQNMKKGESGEGKRVKNWINAEAYTFKAKRQAVYLVLSLAQKEETFVENDDDDYVTSFIEREVN